MQTDQKVKKKLNESSMQTDQKYLWLFSYEEMQNMDEAFDILGFTHEEKYDVYRVSALCMQFSKLEFQGMGEVASPKNLDAGEHLNSILNFADTGEAMYDAFINPKFKVNILLNDF